MGNFDGKIAVVTGGFKGIGKAISHKLAAEGAKVYAMSRNLPQEKLFEDDFINSRVTTQKCDVSDKASVEEAIGTVVKTEKRLDILINNAGITNDNLLLRMSEEDFMKVIDINLKGAFLTTKAVIRTMMSQRHGRIINIGSIVGTIGNPGQSNYASSKAGLIGLTKSLAKEFASRNITVNLIAPGYVDTNMTGDLTEEQKEYFLKNIPLKRIAAPEEIANVVSFFASEGASYITGQVLHVDGGLAI